MVCLTSPVGHTGVSVRMHLVAVTENGSPKSLSKKGNLVALDIRKEEVGSASESPGSRTGSIRTVFPFLGLKSWLLSHSHSFCHFRWLLEWR